MALNTAYVISLAVKVQNTFLHSFISFASRLARSLPPPLPSGAGYFWSCWSLRGADKKGMTYGFSDLASPSITRLHQCLNKGGIAINLLLGAVSLNRINIYGKPQFVQGLLHGNKFTQD